MLDRQRLSQESGLPEFDREDLPGHLNNRLNDWEVSLVSAAVEKFARANLPRPVLETQQATRTTILTEGMSPDELLDIR